MFERDAVLEALYAIRDRELPELDTAALSAKTQAAVEREIERERRGGRLSGVLWGRHRPSKRIFSAASGIVTVGLAVVVVAAVAIVLFALRPRGAVQQTGAGASGLTARLAVLRRPQTPSDRLPANVRLPFPGSGKVVPGLTRLVVTQGGVRLFLVVSEPHSGPNALWSPTLGDQVSIVALSPYGTTQTMPVPAADLTNAQQIGVVGVPIARLIGAHHAKRSVALKDEYVVGIVPDGVAHVHWTFGTPGPRQRKPVMTLTPAVSHNIAYAHLVPHALPALLTHATWYGANHAVIPTSDRALRQAIQARQNEQKEQALRTLSRYPAYHAPRALLADFAVFAITSRSGVRISSGLTVSRPRVSSLPAAVLDLIERQYTRTPLLSKLNRQPVEPDLSQIRQITSPTGLSAWIVPGRNGLCLFASQPPRGPAGALGGGGASGGCAPSLRQAEQGGAGESAGQTPTTGIYYIVVPKSRPTTKILSGPHHWRTIRPPYGVFIGTGYPEG